ncbi:hypothetical protein [Nocardioides sp. B-3]|uniref:hypothetical protein n=1 Tax=Nocardioides sp. B-3 TaxID=2895565 RepID=UPI0021520352|nr:hypothetical protein [Nocardioides sp. B-3]UUZ57708.1 hypothetical protein LP418_14820 [Nocardioides sp. B-3]
MAPTRAVGELLDRVRDRPGADHDDVVGQRAAYARGDELGGRHRAQRVVQDDRFAGAADRIRVMPESRGVTPASPSARAAQATSASPWINE